MSEQKWSLDLFVYGKKLPFFTNEIKGNRVKIKYKSANQKDDFQKYWEHISILWKGEKNLKR